MKDFLNSSDDDIHHEEEAFDDSESLSAAIALEVSIYLENYIRCIQKYSGNISVYSVFLLYSLSVI